MTKQIPWIRFEDELPPIGAHVLVKEPEYNQHILVIRMHDDNYTCHCGGRRVNVRFPVGCMWQYLPNGEIKKGKTDENNNVQ